MNEPRLLPTDLETRLRTTMKHSAAYSVRENEERLVQLGLEAAAEIERLKTLVPAGDYVLTDDMSEETSKRWGKGLFCGFDDIKSVES